MSTGTKVYVDGVDVTAAVKITAAGVGLAHAAPKGQPVSIGYPTGGWWPNGVAAGSGGRNAAIYDEWSSYRYGDVLRYHNQPGAEDCRFMFLRADDRSYQVLVIATAPEDDLWVPGETIIHAGLDELVPE